MLWRGRVEAGDGRIGQEEEQAVFVREAGVSVVVGVGCVGGAF